MPQTTEEEYDIHAHLANDDKIFCSLSNDETESFYPEDIERIEVKMGAAEEDEFGDLVLEERLTPEPHREGPAPIVGKAVYRDGERVSTEFDFSEVPESE